MFEPEHKPSRVQGRSVRFRLLAIALLPVLVILPLLLGVTFVWWNAKFDAMLISKINGDLTIAHQYLSRILEKTGAQIRALGLSADFRDVVSAGGGSNLDRLLQESRLDLGLDFLYLTDKDGAVLAAAPQFASSSLRNDWPVIASALQRAPRTEIDIFTNEELNAIGPPLAGRARLELVPTPNAVHTDRNTETRGMVVHSASPVVLPDGRTAALVGGILLNQNLEFIDTINDLVYREASLPEGSRGTATLFLEDVRISTNVRLFEGRRALGTRVSSVVRSTVLDSGRVWLDSAFVVNDWYISGYEPIIDSYDKRVGMLYVGFLEAPFTRAKYATLLAVVGRIPCDHGGERADLPALGASNLHAAGADDRHDCEGRKRRSRRAHRPSRRRRRDRARRAAPGPSARSVTGAGSAVARVERRAQHARQ